jgi:hypothetical protein
MKKFFAVAAVLVVAGLVSAVMAQDAPKPHKVHGKIVSISDDGKITFTQGHGDNAKTVVVATDANTKLTLDKNPAKLTDLKAGMFVVNVVADEGKPATQVDVLTKMPPKGGAAPANPPAAGN